MKKYSIFGFFLLAILVYACGDKQEDGPVNVPVIPVEGLVFPLEMDFKWKYLESIDYAVKDTIEFNILDIFEQDGKSYFVFDKHYLKDGQMVLYNSDQYGFASSGALSDKLNVIKYPATLGHKIINGMEITPSNDTLYNVAKIVHLDHVITVPKGTYPCVVVNLYKEDPMGVKDTTYEEYMFLRDRVGLVRIDYLDRSGTKTNYRKIELVNYNFSASK